MVKRGISLLSVGLIVLLLLYFYVLRASSSSLEHPYIYVSSEDLPLIRKKIAQEPFKSSWEQISQDTGILSLAFTYLINRNTEEGHLAIQKSLAQLRATSDIRPFYNAMMIGACVYDWCYPLLSQEQKNSFVHEFTRIASLHAPGYPASRKASSIVGHNSEGWLLTGQLPAGLAIYQEAPLMYDSALRLFMEKFVPARNFFYASHMHHQGNSYAATRFQHDIMASWLLKKAIEKHDIFSKDQQFVPYQFIYHLRPDGLQLHTGDAGDERGKSLMKRRVALLTACYYTDPYLLTLADAELFAPLSIEDKIFEIIFRPIAARSRPLEELPLTKYFPPPMGEMVARTGWEMGLESNDALVHMRIGEYFFGNHQHKDFGTFQFYYKGALAVNSGVYGGKDNRASYGKAHWLNYYHQTIAHNGLLIYDPAEAPDKDTKFIATNDGGQQWPNKANDHPRDLPYLLKPEHGYKMGNVTALEFGPDSNAPEYTYIAGDISNAYSKNKVDKVTRSMLTLNTGNDRTPCILVVYDQVKSTQPDFQKNWLIHSLDEPEVSGNTIIIQNKRAHYKGELTYSGQLNVTSLLPKQTNISKIGGKGKEYWIESADHNFFAENTSKGTEAAHWRIEVSPEQTAEEDRFLHVLSATSAGMPLVYQKPKLMESHDLEGALFSEWGVLFNKTPGLLENIQMEVPGDAPKKFFLAGLYPGEWVLENAEGEKAFSVKEEGKCAYLLLSPGINALTFITKNMLPSDGNETNGIVKSGN
jgi:heparin/heparan-sulfate lyase